MTHLQSINKNLRDIAQILHTKPEDGLHDPGLHAFLINNFLSSPSSVPSSPTCSENPLNFNSSPSTSSSRNTSPLPILSHGLPNPSPNDYLTPYSVLHSSRSMTPNSYSKAKKRKKEKDPNLPKQAMTSYFHFCQEERSKVKAEFPKLNQNDVAVELGFRWNSLSSDRKKVPC